MRNIILGVTAAACLCPGISNAQTLNPRESLRSIITAFQRCGPPEEYQALSPFVFNAVAQQTRGSGCYQDIALAGPVTRLRVREQREFPLGPLYRIRVTHQTGTVADWFIGFNGTTGKIEYLNYQPSLDGEETTIDDGPDPDVGITGQQTDQSDTPPENPDCLIWAVMCLD